ncbi:hypothetical protein MEA186_23386 [Mesorhizobium amorphae CCNWGS0123]|uniref:Uncharacterized protein n=1 Tax=Mesorhizobium amorphae CCNWGS0123 TaxID=1082933 RepID=G6YFD0_9HYPH|nr:hypothetical protein MEA186_23386 [Mesorhizobium amorphae CCNWGS0123]
MRAVIGGNDVQLGGSELGHSLKMLEGARQFG